MGKHILNNAPPLLPHYSYALDNVFRISYSVALMLSFSDCSSPSGLADVPEVSFRALHTRLFIFNPFGV